MRSPNKYATAVESTKSTLYGSLLSVDQKDAPAGKVRVDFTHKPGEVITDAGGRKYIVWHDRSLRRCSKIVKAAVGPVEEARKRAAQRIEENRNTIYGEGGEPRPETDDEVRARLLEHDRQKIEEMVAASTAEVEASVADEPEVTQEEMSGKQEADA